MQQSTTHIIGIILQKGYVCQFTVVYFCHYVHSKGAQSTMCWILLNVKHVISCSSPALSSESVFPLLCFFFCEKASCAALLSVSEIQRDYKRRGHKGCPPFHAAHRETMDRLVLLGRLSDNTAACDAALEAGIQPRLLLYKWSGPH